MEYNKTGDWENACNRADSISSNKQSKNERSEKVVDVFNSFFQLLKT
jgi:hypothetical protein